MKISFHAFWDRFFDDEQNNISFFKELFSEVENLIYVKDASQSDIIVNSLYGTKVKRDNKIHILFGSEPNYPKDEDDIVLGGLDETIYKNAINIPLFLSYLYCNNFLERCINKTLRTVVPSKFCCWIVSNDKCIERNNIFFLLNSYKSVHSVGMAFNTTGYLLTHPWGSKGFFDFISQYKFVICGENTKIDQYITEKIFHGYLSQTIPIYYGSDYSKKVFNSDSYLNLENTDEQSYMKLLNRVIEIDNDDSKWLSIVNSPVFINNSLPEELQMKNLKKKVAERIKNSKYNINIMTEIRRPFIHFKNKYLIETGTHKGDGIQDALDAGFEIIHSYEVFPPLHEESTLRFKDKSNVHIHLKSSVNMWDELSQISEPITFWLDGHKSGYNNETGYDEMNFYPLKKELEVIAKHPIKTHTICIDDRRLLKPTYINTPESIGFSEAEILKLLYDINPDYTVGYMDGFEKDDVIVAYLKPV
jgi:hypothetical protein